MMLPMTRSLTRLTSSLVPVNGRLADADHRNAVHVLQPALDDADAEHVGDEEERRRRALQLLEQLDDARLRAERQRDVDLADAFLVGVGGDLGQRAQHLGLGLGVDAIVVAVVEEADELDARRRRLPAARARP